MRVNRQCAGPTSCATIIGSIIPANVNLHSSVNNAIKVPLVALCPLPPCRILFSVAPILQFNQNSALDVTVLDQPITNISFFFNTIQSNGTLFELTFSAKSRRTRRETTSPRIIGRLVNGRFRLLVIANEPPFQEYELRNEHLLNDGRPHRIELDLDHNRLVIDGIYNESLTKLQGTLRPNQVQFLSDQSIDGWLQDVRINNQPILLNNATASNGALRVNASNIHRLENNPCYPNNPCLNRGLCLVTEAQRSL